MCITQKTTTQHHIISRSSLLLILVGLSITSFMLFHVASFVRFDLAFWKKYIRWTLLTLQVIFENGKHGHKKIVIANLLSHHHAWASQAEQQVEAGILLLRFFTGQFSIVYCSDPTTLLLNRNVYEKHLTEFYASRITSFHEHAEKIML